MSVMAQHIRVLRAEAAALKVESSMSMSKGDERQAAGELESARAEFHLSLLFWRLSRAKFHAADALEAEEPKLREETPVNYDPKGKR